MTEQVERNVNFNVKGDFYGGEFHLHQASSGRWIGKSPADRSDLLGEYVYSFAAVDEVVRSARAAQRSWQRRGFQERVGFLKSYQSELEKREKDLCEVIAREMGKPFWEAKTEVASMIAKVDISIQDGMKGVSEYSLPDVMPRTNGVCRFRPLGVVVVLGPFNFPGHLPNGHIVPALLTGNTVVFKPSEKTPMTGQLMAECFLAAGLPSGVFNLIQGEREIGRRLALHEDVNGVFFTGSYDVGLQIKQDTIQQHWKLLALEMGGKNSAIVWSDAHLDHAVYECLNGAFLTTGQRCSATSRIMVHRLIADAFVERLHEKAKAFSISHPLRNPFMGPLIDDVAVQRYMKFLGIAAREGYEVVMRGKEFEGDFSGSYVTPSICLGTQVSLAQTKKSVYQQTELFAPNVLVIALDDIDEAIDQANATQFGLVASVFSRDQQIYDHCLQRLEVGLVNWNKSTVGASSRLPFGGLKKSGNHFPTAVSASAYCVHPVASLENSEPSDIEDQAAKVPGLNWNKKGK